MSIRIDGTNTTANPGITGADTDTGLQFGTDEVKVVTGGSDRVTVDSSGQCGIGTSVPSELLHIAGATNPAITLQDTTNNTDARIKTNNNGDLVFEADYNNEQGDTRIGFELDGSEKVRVDSSGRVGIGETSMDGLLVIKGDSNDTSMPSIRLKDGTDSREAWISNSSGDLVLVNGGDDNTPHCKITMFDGNIMSFATANTERYRISSNGHLSVGTTTDNPGDGNTTAGTSFNANGKYFISCAADGGHINRNNDGAIMHCRRSGSLVGSITVNSSSTSFNENSDYRLKENIVDITDGITRLKQLQPRRFNFIVDPENTVDGFIAHEAQAVVPQAVTGTHNEVDDDGNPVMQGIDKSKLVPLLTAALQEAISEIETLETQNTAQQAQIDDLLARVTALEATE